MPVYTWKQEPFPISVTMSSSGTYKETQHGWVLYADEQSTGLGYYTDSDGDFIPTHLPTGLALFSRDEEIRWISSERIARAWLCQIVSLTDWTQITTSFKRTKSIRSREGLILHYRIHAALYTCLADEMEQQLHPSTIVRQDGKND